MTHSKLKYRIEYLKYIMIMLLLSDFIDALSARTNYRLLNLAIRIKISEELKVSMVHLQFTTVPFCV